MSFDLYQLRTFCLVAEEENISRAAVRLHLSAPAVSSHIKTLEEALGVALFTRSSAGMTLTEAGHALWEEAEGILKQVAAFRRRASGLSGVVSGTLRIGINNPPESLHIPEIIAALGGKHGALRFEYIFGNSQFILTGLRQETLDIGFFETETVPAEIGGESLEDREVVLIAPKAWGAELAAAPVEQLQDYPWIFASEGCSFYHLGRRWFEAHHMQVVPRIRSDDSDHTTAGFVARELGLSLIASRSLAVSAYRDSVAILPQFSANVPLSLGYRKDRRGDAMIAAAVGEILEVFRIAPAGSALQSI